jgi:hypothetical protein
MVYRAMIKLLVIVLALCLAASAAHAQAVAGRPTLFMATAVNATSPNAQIITTSGGFTNTALNIVCANFTTPNTGPATVAVDGKPALPVQRQVVPSGLTPLGGGELTGYQCLQVNNASPPTGFVLGGVTGGITPNPGAHPVTVAEWSYGQTFVCSIAGCNLTFPAVSTLPNQGGVNLATVGVQATLTPNAADSIDTGLDYGGAAGVAVTFPADIQSLVVTGGANALSVPMGPAQYFPFAWLPGMDLSTATNGFGVGRTSASPRFVYSIRCQNEVASAGGVMTFYQQTASGFIGAGTTLGSTFNMTATAGTESVNLMAATGPAVVPGNSWIGAKVTGSPGTGGQGRCNVAFR